MIGIKRFSQRFPQCIRPIIISVLLTFTSACAYHDFVLPDKAHMELPDINAQPRSYIRMGGDLHLPMTEWPQNFLFSQFNGALYDLGIMDQMIRPSAFFLDNQGKYYYRHEYFTNISQSITGNTQTITYTINPKTHWSNNEPMTWKDFATYAHALSGRDLAYIPGDTSGYKQITSVRPGINARQAIVVISPVYSGWKDLFRELAPSSAIDSPKKFNTAWINQVPPTAGPFRIQSMDKVKEHIILERDPNWWGSPAKLDRIILKTYNSKEGLAPYLSGELDTVGVGKDVAVLKQALAAPNTTVRRAYSSQWYHLDFNAAPGRISSDRRVRRALAKAIDRSFIQKLFYRTIAPQQTEHLNNHFYMQGQKGYQDNSEGFCFDPVAARAELDAAGWTIGSDGIRHKNGKSMTLDYVTIAGLSGAISALYQIIQHNLADIGVRAIMHSVPLNDFFNNYVNPGNYDLTTFIWISAGDPVVDAEGIYRLDFRCRIDSPLYDHNKCQPLQNWGLVGTREINTEYERIMTITDPEKFIVAANHIDTLLWRDMGSLPLFQFIDCIAIRANLANYGPQLLGSWQWEDIGWLK